MRILVVEDSARLRQTVSTWLRRNGLAVDASADGEEGLYLAETSDYAAVVLDIMMPEVDGWALLQRLRQQGKQTHVLLLTARDTVPDRVRGLALARGEEGGLPVQRQRLELAPLLQEVCDPFREPAAARELALKVNLPVGAVTETDPVLRRSILTNLVDNAVAYTPRGGAVDGEASVEEGPCTLCVANTVDHLDDRDLPHWFERFWRKDAARSADGHTGLGLSLARTFAHAIGCELTATPVGPTRLVLNLAQRESTPFTQPPGTI